MKLQWYLTSGKYALKARISSDNIVAVKSVVQSFVGDSGTVVEAEGELEVSATLSGESSKELNRQLLSSLRRVEKKTRLRSEWTTSETTERYFDYVLKKTITNNRK